MKVKASNFDSQWLQLRVRESIRPTAIANQEGAQDSVNSSVLLAEFSIVTTNHSFADELCFELFVVFHNDGHTEMHVISDRCWL